MNPIKGTIRSGVVHALGPRQAEMIARRYDDVQSALRYRIERSGRRSALELDSLRDIHRGKRCFIIGNGPSLKTMDLSPLRNEVTFGLNRIYLLFDRLGFATTFLVAVNEHVIAQCAGEIAAVQTEKKFVSWHARRYLRDAAGVTYLRSVSRPHFSVDPSAGIWEGATVTYAAMQLAYHMGFKEVLLIGVDHSFVAQGPPHTVVTSTGGDPNHFDPNYFGKGFRWQLPDLETSEYAYRLARDRFEADGRRIMNATVGGRLDVFPRADFTSLFPPTPSRDEAQAAS